MIIAWPHGEKEAIRQRAAQSVSVFRLQLWTAVLALLLMGSSAAAASMRCRIAQQPWSPCRMLASSPGERWVLTWNQQRVEFVHDGSGQMLMRVGQGDEWREVEPFWTVDHSLCWGSVCATGAVPLE